MSINENSQTSCEDKKYLYEIYEKPKCNNKMIVCIVNFIVKNKLAKQEDVWIGYENIKTNFDDFSYWINQLSWGKFIIFLILTNIIGEAIIKSLTNSSGFIYNFFNNILDIFIFGSLALKVFMRTKVKNEAKLKEAQFIAEKEMLQRQLVEAKIQVMQAQIEPHFLFNTLSSLEYLINTDPKKASQMLMSLVSYLRYALPQIRENQSFNTLGKEIQNIQAYLTIMEIRMGDRLNVIYNVSDLLKDIQFPSMMLQPIIENAIKYGIEESVEGGRITISAQYVDNNLEVCVADTGPGLNHTSNSHSKGNGMALNNIKNRLEMLYDKKANFIIMNNEPTGVIVKIQIPVES